MTGAITPPAWIDDAACTQIGPEAFFPEDGDWHTVQAAKRFCKAHCPVIDQCLQLALDLNAREGVWGGTGPSERRRMEAA